MAGMITVLTEFSSNGNSRTSTLVGHTAVKPKLVIEKRKLAEGATSMVEYSFKVVEATTDANGLLLSQKVSFEAVARYPVNGTAADVSATLAVFKDIVGGDEFAASVTSQNWL